MSPEHALRHQQREHQGVNWLHAVLSLVVIMATTTVALVTGSWWQAYLVGIIVVAVAYGTQAAVKARRH